MAAIMLIISMVLTGCSGGGEKSSPGAASATGSKEKALTYAMGATWSSLVPLTNSSYYTNVVQSMIYDRLVRINEKGEIEPRAAESWQVSPDGKTYTLNLRKNSTWSDGKPCTAADWVFFAEYITNPAVVAPQKSNLSMIAGIDAKGNKEANAKLGIYAKDDYTLVLELDNPCFIESLFGTINSYIMAMPKHLLSGMDPSKWASDKFWTQPVTNGPFTFVSEVSGQELVLKARTDYYFKLDFDKLIFKVVSPTNIPTSIMAGEVDLGYPYVTADVAKSLEGKPGVKVIKNTLDTSLMFVSINSKYPKAVRQAIGLAIDKELIVKQLIFGEGEATNNPIMSASPYFNKDLVVKRDVEKAKALLSQAGWDPNKVITLGVSAGVREKIAAVMQQELAEVGVKTKITVYDTTTMFNNLRSGETDCGIITATLNPSNPLFFQNMLKPDVATFACVKEPTFIPLIDQINAEQNTANRVKLAQQFNALFADEAYYIPLYNEYTFVITSDKVSNSTVIGTEAPWEWKVS